MHKHALSGWTLAWLMLLGGVAQAARIEAVPGKEYRLTKRHGPWMIMVASFRDRPRYVPTVDDRLAPNRDYKPGKSAEEAAQELVYELRKLGLPAYTFRQEPEVNRIETRDRLLRPERRLYRAREGRVCVLAGNYPSIDDPIAQKTLAAVKKLHPKCLEGGVYRKTPGRPEPLSGAFLTINPLLSPEEARRVQHDPLLLKLNAGQEYSLADNPGRYTLVVATFYGKSVTQLAGKRWEEVLRRFKVDSTLDEAAENAWRLAKALRTGRYESKLLKERQFEAYVWHDRYQSVVTVGSFDSPNDPEIARLIQIFGAKVRQHPTTGKNILVSEMLVLPDSGRGNGPLKSWVFDPYPRLMEVPRLR